MVVTKEKVLDVISAAARFGMALVWISAGIPKLNHHLTVTQSIEGYQIFTHEWASFLAYLIGPLEVAGGVLLLFGIFLRHSSQVALVVLALFMVGIAQAWARGLTIDCGCFAPAEVETSGMNYAWALMRDVVFVFLAVWTIWRPYRRFAVYI